MLLKKHKYWQLFGEKLVKELTLAGVLYRSASFIVPFALTLVLADTFNSLVIAGIGSGIFLFAGAVGEPIQGRLCDLKGTRKTLLLFSFFFTIFSSILLLSIFLSFHIYLVYIFCLLAGTTLPFVRGPGRSIWWSIFKSDKDRLTASAFEGTIGPLSYASGYLIFALITFITNASFALVFAMLSLLLGTLIIANIANKVDIEICDYKPHPLKTLQNKFMLNVLVITLLIFIVHGILQVFLIANTSATSSGLLIGLIYVMGALTGLAYGSKKQDKEPEKELFISLILFLIGVLGFILNGSIFLLIALIIHGVTRVPVLIYTYHLSVAYTEKQHRTEAMAWNGTAIWAGLAIGKIIAGFAGDFWGDNNIMLSTIPLAVIALLLSLFLIYNHNGQKEREKMKE